MSRFHAGLEIERQTAGAWAQRLAMIGLAPGQLVQLVDLIPMELFEASPMAAITHI
jgi:hypothetical protein